MKTKLEFVGQIDLTEIFSSARKKIVLDFASRNIFLRVKKVKLVVANSRTLARSVGRENLRSFSCISAYYNPNSQRVYLNRDLLDRINEETVFNIFYHELLHAATKHRNYSRTDSRVFQSGVKLEIYCNGRYLCLNRLLNEGIVEYFSSINNNRKKSAYPDEVELVRKIANDLGPEVLQEAIIDARLKRLETEFNNKYGKKTFRRFSSHLDHKRYNKALSLISN